MQATQRGFFLAFYDDPAFSFFFTDGMGSSYVPQLDRYDVSYGWKRCSTMKGMGAVFPHCSVLPQMYAHRYHRYVHTRAIIPVGGAVAVIGGSNGHASFDFISFVERGTNHNPGTYELGISTRNKHLDVYLAGALSMGCKENPGCGTVEHDNGHCP